jgi:hypothetical protein
MAQTWAGTRPSFETGGITTDGTKLYVEALGQIFSIDMSGSTPALNSPLAGENDSTRSERDDLDFASGYNPKALIRPRAWSCSLLTIPNLGRVLVPLARL